MRESIALLIMKTTALIVNWNGKCPKCNYWRTEFLVEQDGERYYLCPMCNKGDNVFRR